jgi:uncharacterized damage-inducible protein DinB
MDLSNEIDSLTTQVNENFGQLNAAQLNWKPASNAWSIGQCLNHIMVSNQTYMPTFNQVLNGSYRLSFFQKINPFKKALGPTMVKSLGPQSEKKFPSPKVFEPSSSDIPADIVSRFNAHQEEIKRYFSALQQKDTSRIVIASPVSSIITYSLADALKIITGHEQRHVSQAIAVLNHPNFPKS